MRRGAGAAAHTHGQEPLQLGGGGEPATTACVHTARGETVAGASRSGEVRPVHDGGLHGRGNRELLGSSGVTAGATYCDGRERRGGKQRRGLTGPCRCAIVCARRSRGGAGARGDDG